MPWAASSRWLRRRARAYGMRGVLKTGGVTLIQRFGSAFNLSVHFQTLIIDGVYEIARTGGQNPAVVGSDPGGKLSSGDGATNRMAQSWSVGRHGGGLRWLC
jgi:hypothetical protein